MNEEELTTLVSGMASGIIEAITHSRHRDEANVVELGDLFVAQLMALSRVTASIVATMSVGNGILTSERDLLNSLNEQTVKQVDVMIEAYRLAGKKAVN